MGDKLVPGGLGAATDVGKPADFAGTMAEAIEDALWALLAPDRRFNKNDNSPEARDRRMLFVAIAQGVCGHLQQNAAAFTVTHTTGTAVTHQVQIGVET